MDTETGAKWSRRRSWKVGLSASFGFLVVLSLMAYSLSSWNNPRQSALPAPTISKSPAMTVAEQQAAAAKAELSTHLLLNGPAYNCAHGRNDNAKRIADLVVCPLHLAIVDLKGNKPDQRPVITRPLDSAGKPLFNISYVHDGGWQTVDGQRVYRAYWTITIKCDPRMFPAGVNRHRTQNASEFPGKWTGPDHIGECDKSFPLDAAVTDTIEFYGADPTLALTGTVLPQEKYGVR